MSNDTASGHTRSSLRRAWATRLGLILLPLLIVSGFLWATSGSGSRLHDTEAAIVNLDQGAVLAGQNMHLGQDYALDLKNQNGPNFTWRYGISLEEANAGLASGRYSAAVIIPPAFSRVLTGTAGKAEQATLQVERSPISGVSDQLVISQLSLAATRSLSGEVTRRYLDDVFVNTTELGKSLGHTTALAQDVTAGAAELQGAARTANSATTEVAKSAAGAVAGVTEAGSAASQAATSSKDAGTAGQGVASSAETAASDNSAQRKAIQDAADQAKGVAESADKAKTSTGEVGKQATAAGEQGGETKKSADAVAAAAAANKAAADAYGQKVADVIKAQQDIAEQLAAAAEQTKKYTATTATVTGAVADARKVLAAASAATPTAAPAATPSPAPAPAPSSTAPQMPRPTALPAEVPAADSASAKQLRAKADELTKIAATVDAVITANGASAGATPAAVAGAVAAAQSNAKAAQDVAKAAQGAVAENQRIVVQATTVKTQALAASQAAAQSQAQAQAAQEAIGAVSGTITYASQPKPCPNGWSADRCAAYKNGFKDAIDGVTVSREIKGKAEALDAQKAAVTQAKEAAVAADATVTAATTTVTVAESTQKQLATIVATATPLATTNTELATTVAGIAQASSSDLSRLQGIPQRLTSIAEQLVAVADTLEQPTGPVDPTATPIATPTPSGPGVPTDTGAQAKLAELQADLDEALGSVEVDAALTGLPEQGKALETQATVVADQADKNVQAMAGIAPEGTEAKAVTSAVTGMTDTATEQAAVVAKLQDTLTQLNTGMDALATTMGTLSTDSAALGTSTSKVNDGATALAVKVDALNTTIGNLQKAATRASADAATAQSRTVALQQQITTLQQASGVLSTHTAVVVTQADQQVEKASTVVNELESSAAQLPSYDDTTRQRLSTAVSAPITTSEQSNFRNIGWVSMLMLLSLWAGAMGLHSMFNPISARARRSTEAPAKLLAHEMLPTGAIAIAQALAVSGVGQLVLHLPAGRWAAVTAALVLSALMFATVNHVLVSFGRMWGRLLAVAFAMVTGTGIVTQAYPESMTALRTISPISPALGMTRSLMTGVPMGSTDTLVLGGWLLIGLLFSALAILRAREPEPVRVPTVYSQPRD